jgi:hypothetical protein
MLGCMGYAKHIGRVGALAVALGVGSAIVSLPAVALASTDEGSSDSSTNDSSNNPSNASPNDPSKDDGSRDSGSANTGAGPSNTGSPTTTTGNGRDPVDEKDVDEKETDAKADDEKHVDEKDADQKDADNQGAVELPDLIEDVPVEIIDSPKGNDYTPPQGNQIEVPELAGPVVTDVDEVIKRDPPELSTEPLVTLDPVAGTGTESPIVSTDPVIVEEPGEPSIITLGAGPLDGGGAPGALPGPSDPMESPAIVALFALTRRTETEEVALQSADDLQTANALVSITAVQPDPPILFMIQIGDFTFTSTGWGSFALSIGAGSKAYASGWGSYAIAIGVNASARATGGVGNRAFAWGTSAIAEAGGDGEGNDYNRAIAFNGGTAIAGHTGDDNDFNRAIANHFGIAIAGNGGCSCQGGNDNDNNVASADGAGSQAYAGYRGERNNGNRAWATGEGVAAAGAFGDGNSGNSAAAGGVGSSASAGIVGSDNSGNTATATGGALSEAGSYGDGNTGNAATAADGGSDAAAGIDGSGNTGNVASATASGVAMAGSGDCSCQSGNDNANNIASADGAGSVAYAGYGGARNNGNQATATAGGYAQAGSLGDDLVGWLAVAGAGEVVIRP